MTDQQKLLPPGSTIGMLGDGQLGRMTSIAGVQMGYHFAILGPGGKNSPAGEVSKYAWSWGKNPSKAPLVTLRRFVKTCDVITYEWENVPSDLILRLKAVAREMDKSIAFYPDPSILAIAQDRLLEKQFFARARLETVAYLDSSEFTPEKLETISWPCILKTRKDGYDGKGQIGVTDVKDLPAAIAELQGDDSEKQLILESKFNFDYEMSVMVARNVSGECVTYPMVKNEHANGILWKSTYDPDSYDEHITRQADQAARTLAEELDLVGVLGVEMFAFGKHIVINEIAPRPHNSGHWTIEGCTTSQFAMHVLAVCNRRLFQPAPHCGYAEMTNLLGVSNAEIDERTVNSESIHLYGKAEAKPGRKMGHRTLIIR